MNETNTRLWVALFVALVFVCGLSIGIAVSAWMGPGADSARFRGPLRPGGPRPSPPTFVSQRILDRLERESDLTGAQREGLEALFAERENRFSEFNREMRRRFELEQTRLREDIAAILTAEQMEVFDAARRPGRGRPRPGGGRGREP